MEHCYVGRTLVLPEFPLNCFYRRRWDRWVFPKRRYGTTNLHCVTSQNTADHVTLRRKPKISQSQPSCLQTSYNEVYPNHKVNVPITNANSAALLTEAYLHRADRRKTYVIDTIKWREAFCIKFQPHRSTAEHNCKFLHIFSANYDGRSVDYHRSSHFATNLCWALTHRIIWKVEGLFSPWSSFTDSFSDRQKDLVSTKFFNYFVNNAWYVILMLYLCWCFFEFGTRTYHLQAVSNIQYILLPQKFYMSHNLSELKSLSECTFLSSVLFGWRLFSSKGWRSIETGVNLRVGDFIALCP